MKAREQEAYEVGVYEASHGIKRANWEDFSMLIGHPDDYEFYLDGYCSVEQTYVEEE